GAGAPVRGHAPVRVKAGGADGQGVDAAVDPGVLVADQVKDGANEFTAPHVLAAAWAVHAVGGRHDLLAARALHPLLGRLVAADGGLGEILTEVAEVLYEAHRGVEDRLRLGLLPERDGGE